MEIKEKLQMMQAEVMLASKLNYNRHVSNSNFFTCESRRASRFALRQTHTDELLNERFPSSLSIMTESWNLKTIKLPFKPTQTTLFNCTIVLSLEART